MSTLIFLAGAWVGSVFTVVALIGAALFFELGRRDAFAEAALRSQPWSDLPPPPV